MVGRESQDAQTLAPQDGHVTLAIRCCNKGRIDRNLETKQQDSHQLQGTCCVTACEQQLQHQRLSKQAHGTGRQAQVVQRMGAET